MHHIMLDLETLDTESTAVVTAIGAVFFDPSIRWVGPAYYAVMDDWREQVEIGRTISPETVKWWLKQSDDARKELHSPLFPTSLSDALNGFKGFVSQHGNVDPNKVCVWGNGANFDNVILRSLYKSYGEAAPWAWYNDRCYRTLKSLGSRAPKIEFQGERHNARADAINQAENANEIMHRMTAFEDSTL